MSFPYLFRTDEGERLLMKHRQIFNINLDSIATTMTSFKDFENATSHFKKVLCLFFLPVFINLKRFFIIALTPLKY
jgi:hypothetical protein